ncbi:unnamed protein product, partial [marine sediment metagenome]
MSDKEINDLKKSKTTGWRRYFQAKEKVTSLRENLKMKSKQLNVIETSMNTLQKELYELKVQKPVSTNYALNKIKDYYIALKKCSEEFKKEVNELENCPIC